MGGCIPLILTLGLATGHKLQKPSKESGIFQSLGTISFVLFFTKRQSQKGGRMAQWPSSEYAPGHIHIGYQSNLFEILFFHLQYLVFSLKTSVKTSG